MKRVVILLSFVLLTAACEQRPVDSGLSALADRQAIDQLVAGDYPRALDSRQWKDYVALFTEDGELALLGQTTKGRPALLEFLNNFPDDNVVHVITNLSYKIQGDTATGGAYWQDVGLANNLPAVVAAGHYEDSLRKVNGDWKFAKRVIVIKYQMPNPAAPAATSSSE